MKYRFVFIPIVAAIIALAVKDETLGVVVMALAIGFTLGKIESEKFFWIALCMDFTFSLAFVQLLMDKPISLASMSNFVATGNVALIIIVLLLTAMYEHEKEEIQEMTTVEV